MRSVAESSLKAVQAIQIAVTGENHFTYRYTDVRKADASCDLDRKVLKVPVFGYLSEADDKFTRYLNFHENFHVLWTAANKDKAWTRLKGTLVNVIEDLRIERNGQARGMAYTNVVLEGREEAVKRFAGKIDAGKNGIGKIFGKLMMEEYGYDHITLDAPTQAIYNAIYDTFKKWKKLPNGYSKKGYYEVITLADEIIAILKAIIPPPPPPKSEEEKQKEKEEKEKKEQEKKDKQDKKDKSDKKEKSDKKDKGEKSDDGEKGDKGEKSDDKDGEPGDDGEESEDDKDGSGKQDKKDSKKKDKKDKKEKSDKGEKSDENEDGEKSDDEENEDGEGSDSDNEDGEGSDDESDDKSDKKGKGKNSDDESDEDNEDGEGSDDSEDSDSEDNEDSDSEDEKSDKKSDKKDKKSEKKEKSGKKDKGEKSEGSEDSDDAESKGERGTGDVSDEEEAGSIGDEDFDVHDDTSAVDEMKKRMEQAEKGIQEVKFEDLTQEQQELVKAMLEDEEVVDVLQQMVQEEMKQIAEESLENCPYIPYTDKDVIRTIEGGDESNYNRSYQQINVAMRQIQQVLEHVLMSEKKNKRLANMERGKFDVRKAYRLTKSVSKAVFYKKQLGKDLNTVVSLVVDESGSMGGQQIDTSRAMAIAFAECLNKIGIPFEIVGYTTATWDSVAQEGFAFDRTIPLRIDIFKNFTDKYMAVKTRLGKMAAYNHNIDGEAVKIVGTNLASRKEKRKIMMVLSDGLPQGDDESNYKLNQNLKDEIKKCREGGIEVYGFGIEVDNPRIFYGEKNFVYVSDINNLGAIFFDRLKEVLMNGKNNI